MRINSVVMRTYMQGTFRQKKNTIQEDNYNAILEAESEISVIRQEIDHIWATHPNKEEAANILYDICVPKMEKATAKAQKAIENWNASLGISLN
jgi:hypothetical protein